MRSITVILVLASAALLAPAAEAAGGSASSSTTAEALRVIEGAPVRVTRGAKARSASRGARALAAYGCRTVSASVAGKNIFGVVHWRYTQRISWCYDGFRITSVSRTVLPEVYTLFWAFKGNVQNWTVGGRGSTSFRGFAQGYFALCAALVECVQHSYPWIDITVRGNGGYSISKSW